MLISLIISLTLRSAPRHLPIRYPFPSVEKDLADVASPCQTRQQEEQPAKEQPGTTVPATSCAQLVPGSSAKPRQPLGTSASN